MMDLTVPDVFPEIFKDERKKTYLNQEGADRPLKSPIPHETLVSARRYRLGRLREQLRAHDCAAILLYDPVNIRYAFDCTNMQIWTAHNAIRYALIFADGPGIMFEFKGCEHLCDGYEGIDEVRNAIGWIYMSAGDRAAERLKLWAGEIDELVRAHDFYNTERPHSSLAGQTPAEAYGTGRPVDMMDKPDRLPTSPQAQQQQKDVITRVLAA